MTITGIHRLCRRSERDSGLTKVNCGSVFKPVVPVRSLEDRNDFLGETTDPRFPEGLCRHPPKANFLKCLTYKSLQISPTSRSAYSSFSLPARPNESGCNMATLCAVVKESKGEK